MNGMTLSQIQIAFEAALMAQIKAWNATTDAKNKVQIAPQNQASPTAPVYVISRVVFGKTTAVELGGPAGLSQRTGVYIITLSLPKNLPTIQQQGFAMRLEKTFRRVVLPPCLSCTEPYTVPAGDTPDGRYSIMVNVPFETLYSTED